VTYEPQWGSDVFSMYQSMVEGRRVPWDLLVKDVPKEKHQDLDYLVEQVDWDRNTDTHFKDNHYMEPIPVAGSSSDGWTDRWIVYGTVDGKQLFAAKELTVQPGAKCTIKDGGAYGLIAVQGSGRIGKMRLDTPTMIRFGEMTEDEVFVSYEAAVRGVTFENTGTGLLVSLRYFGPDACTGVPAIGDHKKRR
jgi:hypothetical protein